MKLNKILKYVAFPSLILFPFAVLATCSGPFCSKNQIINWLQNSIVNFFGNLILTISTLIILYSAFLFITAGGDPNRIEKAKSILIYGMIGIAVAILADKVQPLIVSFLL